MADSKGRTTILAALTRGRPLISDGAWGTMLQASGLKSGEPPELWNISNPDAVYEVARRYVEAGADMVETNSFGGTRFKLEHHGLADRCGEINEAAAALSRRAAGDSRWVIGSVGPTGKMLIMGDVTEDELYEAFVEQVSALERGGADAICVETMSDIEEARLAVRAAKERTSLEVIATFTFERTLQGEYRTMMGTAPVEATAAMLEAGADIIGTNCGNGFERMIDIVGEIRQAFPEAPILVHANAGLPVHEDGVDRYSDTPETMAALAPKLVAAGASIVGGCCGTNPEYITAIRNAINTP
ncbi:MAG: methionine synthase [Spirochaetaceae bacterium]|nr:MAG: methionine synthase [Spirochaetaceae bacterium]